MPALGHAVSGAVGSAISKVITYPLSLLITRLQTQHQLRDSDGKGRKDEYKDIIDAARRIYAEEGGISAFYAGCLEDTVKTMADAFLFFLAYHFIRQGRRNARNEKRLPMHEELGVGMLAGAFARFITTPAAQIVTRKQVGPMVAARDDETSTVSPELSTRDIVLRIHHQTGLLGFWSGYSASLILTINPSLTLLFHEAILRTLVRREKRSDLGSHLTFLIAATSKAMASAITYPFQLTKARAQVSSHPRVYPSNDKISEKDSTTTAAEESAKKLERRTVFHAVARIVREEGILGLYQGLAGQIVNGFFSHGLTMLMKARIHVAVIQLYYLILKALKRYPSPEELARLAKERVNGAKNGALAPAGTDLSESARTAGERTQQVLNEASVRTQELLEKGMNTICELYRHGKEGAQDIVDEYIGTDDED